MASAFDAVYRDNRWGFGSGHGSLPNVTSAYREFLEGFIRDHGVRKVLDYGCGDWQFSRLIDWQGASYLGVDVVADLVADNARRFGRDNVAFRVAPNDPADLPVADLLVAKDVLQHLPNADVSGFLSNAAPRYPLALIINDAADRGSAHMLNTDVKIGGWRPLDITRAPFYADAEIVATFHGPRVRARGLRGLRRGNFNAWTKHAMLLRGDRG